jgi:hypothetical protein
MVAKLTRLIAEAEGTLSAPHRSGMAAEALRAKMTHAPIASAGSDGERQSFPDEISARRTRVSWPTPTIASAATQREEEEMLQAAVAQYHAEREAEADAWGVSVEEFELATWWRERRSQVAQYPAFA